MNHSRIRSRFLCAAVAAGAATLAAPVAAPAAEPAEDRWQFSVVPYIWIPGVDTTFRVNGVPAEGNDSTSGINVFDELEFALMGAVDVRRGRWGATFDFQYVRLGDEFSADLSGGTVLDSDFDLTLASATVSANYRFVAEPKYTLDGLAGARVLHVDFSAELDSSAGASFDGDEDVTLVDPIVGVRGLWNFAGDWSVSGYGDIGGFGAASDLTWQAMATLNYRFNEHWELRAGYRAFAVDFDKSGLELDALLHGPIVGLVISF